MAKQYVAGMRHRCLLCDRSIKGASLSVRLCSACRELSKIYDEEEFEEMLEDARRLRQQREQNILTLAQRAEQGLPLFP